MFQNNCKAAAHTALDLGFSVLPIAFDGSKRPLVDSWKIYQNTPATHEEIEQWYSQWPKAGVGIIGGAVSGGLVWLDFDKKSAFTDFCTIARLSGNPDLKELVSRVRKGYTEASPKGVHLALKCARAIGSIKLATTGKVDASGQPVCLTLPSSKLKQEIDVLVETKSEGGYCIAAPSAGTVHQLGLPYEIISGGLETIATVTPNELDLLLELARSMHKPTADELEQKANQAEYEAKRAAKAASKDSDSSGVDDGTLRPGDDFNQRATWREILTPHGWTELNHHGAKTYWCRPGKTDGISAVSNEGSGDDALFFAFTTSTQFLGGKGEGKGYLKFTAYTLLNHNGNAIEAAKDLAAKGYGTPSPKLNKEQWKAAKKIEAKVQAEKIAAAPLPIQPSREISSKYLEQLNHDASKLATCVQSAKGTGKTAWLKFIVAYYQLRGVNVVVVGHRVSLLKSQAEQFSLDFYLEGKKRTSIDGSAVVCLNSIARLGKLGDFVLIVDECEQALAHLTGDTLKPKRGTNIREIVLEKFAGLILTAKHSFWLDADLGSITQNYLLRYLDPANIEFIRNSYKNGGKQFIEASSPEALINQVVERLASGQKGWIACNTKEQAMRLSELLKSRYPSLAGWVVTSDNSTQLENQERIADINGAVTAFDYVVVSPSLFTGLDINCQHLDFVALIASKNAATPTCTAKDLLQAVSRVRNPKQNEILFFIDKKASHLETDPEIIKKLVWENLGTHGLTLVEGVDADGKKTVCLSRLDIDYVEHYCEVVAATNASWNDLHTDFCNRATAEGNTVILVKGDDSKELNSSERELKGELIEIGETLKEQHNQAIAAAGNLSEKQFEQLQDKRYLSEAEKAAKDKYQLATFYAVAPTTVTLELVEKDDKGRRRAQIKNFEFMADPEYAKEFDEKDITRDMLPHWKNVVQKSLAGWSIIAEALKKSGSLEPDTDLFQQFSASTLRENGFVAWALDAKNRAMLNQAGIKVRSDFEAKPVQLVVTIAKSIGLTVNKSRNGSNDRQYQIDKKSFKDVQEIYFRRKAGREQRKAEKAGLYPLENAS